MSYRDSHNTDAPKYARMRSMLHLVMGALYLVLGVSVIALHSYGKFELAPGIAYGMGALLIVYGVFRIWRGYSGIRQG
mgnify:FL=1